MTVHMLEGKRESALSVCNKKTGLLRQYEDYCYQIAFYMLRNEGQAMEAAQQALTSLYKCHEWFELSESGRLAKVKHAALMQSLESKKRGMSRAL
ncbi:hypothetical protein [Paenibacillus sp. RC67]|uniref:hypothetical protein n=1 Tax=Paenibacillus sp. RC67 TaxID=3039392 RepID=UPI0024AD8026|nr:hypothetical protein [Paenibacillus sp. RC67]